MSTRIQGAQLSLSIQQTAARQTQAPASRQFGAIVARTGEVAIRAAVGVMQYIPGMGIATAALRGAGIDGLGDGGASPSGSIGTLAGANSAGGSGAGTVATVEAPAAVDGTATATATAPAGSNDQDLLSRGQEQSMRMLRLQESISEENRRFTALSNVMHARHEMAKNAIGNIR